MNKLTWNPCCNLYLLNVVNLCYTVYIYKQIHFTWTHLLIYSHQNVLWINAGEVYQHFCWMKLAPAPHEWCSTLLKQCQHLLWSLFIELPGFLINSHPCHLLHRIPQPSSSARHLCTQKWRKGKTYLWLVYELISRYVGFHFFVLCTLGIYILESGISFVFLAALAALYLTLVSEWLSEWPPL